MCAKREARDVYQPIADLHEEFQREGLAHHLQDLPFIGTVAYYGLLANL